MINPNLQKIRLGILGGGQLGKMFLENASRFGLHTRVLDPQADAPARHLCHEFVQGHFNDKQTVLDFGRDCDYITVEIEHVNIEALHELKQAGKTVHPDPSILETIVDKGVQKKFYRSHSITTSPFTLIDHKGKFKGLIASGWSFPLVVKTRTGGYDGKGVWVIRNYGELDQLPDQPLLVEEMINIRQELAVMVVGNGQDWALYPPVEMVFDPDANLLDYLVAPAQISETIAEKAEALALSTARALGIQGVLGVEMFVDEDDNVLVNEIAPRPHNSGHHTIEASPSSQYDNHLRGILGWPLGETALCKPYAVMMNLLGHPEHQGPVQYVNLDPLLGTPGCQLHLYGKSETKPYRKMAHFTLCGDDRKTLIKTARKLRNEIEIISI